MDKNDKIIRYLIIKAVKDILIQKRPPAPKKPLKKKEDDKKSEVVDEAELDKEIEELLVG